MPMSNRLLRPRATGLDPRSISNLALWFDGSDSTTLFDATSGGSLVAADGAVARWQDKSGNARHATQSTLNARPLRRVGSLKGRDGLEFDGDDALLTASFATTRAMTCWVVHKPTTTAQSNFTRIVEWGANNAMTLFFRDFPPQNYAYSYASNVINNSGVAITTNAATLRFTADGAATSTFTFAVNGGADSTSSNSFTLGTSAAFGISSNGIGANTSKQIVYEILLYTRLLTASEQSRVQGHLRSKWGTY